MTDLLPCPFCGSTPEFRQHGVGDYEYEWADVHCPTCDATIHRAARNAQGNHAAVVVSRWNRRATDGMIDDMIESLQGLKGRK